MISSIIFIFIVFFIILFVIIKPQIREGWDGTGLVFNIPPNWFIKQDYNPSDWVVKTYNEAIQPDCLPYSKAAKWGSLENLNYLGSAQRFWRF